jgi:phosphoserine phosphatase
MQKHLILLKISGQDRPGITANITSLLSKHKITILDIGQSVTRGLLSLSILINSENEDAPVLKDLLFEAKNLKIDLDFEIIEDNNFSQVKLPEFIISCVSPKQISASYIFKLASFLGENDLNILDIENRSAGHAFSSVEFKITYPGSINFKKIQTEILQISANEKIDVSITKNDVFRYNKRLIIFDMDSTLIQTEVIEEIARVAGSFEEVNKITELAMNGSIDFKESLVKRVATLKGVSRHELQSIAEKIELTPGVESFVKTVKSLGLKVGVISGGFHFFTEFFKKKLGLDYAFSNTLEFDADDKLTGKITGNIVDAEQKATLLEMLAQQNSISLEQVVAIGDGANDLLMLSKAGMGIAFQAKKVVRDQASHELSHNSMDSVLTFLAIPENYKVF